jgi:peptidoglycan/LPS O-acetylase OafA/YrhL
MRLSGHITELDGLRGIASLLVLVHHFWPRDSTKLAAVAPVAHLGWVGVDLFFVISGFLIGGILLDSVGREDYYRTFYARRALRIFPLYYLFLLVVFVVVPAAEKGSYFTTEFIRQSGHPLWYFMYLGNLREALIGHEPAYFLAPLWSLSIEEQFYITFPLVVAALNRKHLRTLLYALVIAAPAFRLVSALIVPTNERIQYLATPSRVDVLALGVLLALELRGSEFPITRRQSAIALVVALSVGVGVFLLGGFNRMGLFCRVAGYSILALIFSALVLWTVLSRDGSATSFLRWAGLTRIGKLCYGIYLLQRPAEVLFLKLLSLLHIEVAASPILVILGKIATTVLVASLSWTLFEFRILRLKRYFSQRQPQWNGGLLTEPSPGN